MKHVAKLYAWLVVLTSSKQQLLEIGWQLNNWNWPFKYFGGYYKSMKDYSGDGDTKRKFHRKLFKYVQSKYTEFESLRYHNVIKRKSKTESEFLVWFYTERNAFLTALDIEIIKSIIGHNEKEGIQ